MLRISHRRLFLAVAVIAGLGAAGGTVALAQAGRGPGRLGAPGRPGGPGPMAWMAPQGRAGRLGVSVRDVTASDVAQAQLSSTSGAWITEVHPETPAEGAGMRPNDILVEFDGERVRSARQLARLVTETPPGRTVSVRFVRDGETITADVELASGEARLAEWLPDLRRFDFRIPRIEVPEIAVDVRFGSGRLGVDVQPLGEQLADYFQVDEGVLVANVRPDSPAAAADVRAGDVITAVDGEAVSSPRDLQRAVRRAGGSVTLELTRDGQPVTAEVTLPEEDGRFTRRGQPV